MRDPSPLLQTFTEILSDIVKPALLLLAVFTLLALLAGIFLPIGGQPLWSIAAWFGLLVGGTTAFCVLAYRRRTRGLGSQESPAEFLGDMMYDLLGVIGLPPFALALLFSLAKKGEPSSLGERLPLWLRDPVFYLAVVAALLAIWSARGIVRRLTRR